MRRANQSQLAATLILLRNLVIVMVRQKVPPAQRRRGAGRGPTRTEAPMSMTRRGFVVAAGIGAGVRRPGGQAREPVVAAAVPALRPASLAPVRDAALLRLSRSRHAGPGLSSGHGDQVGRAVFGRAVRRARPEAPAHDEHASAVPRRRRRRGSLAAPPPCRHRLAGIGGPGRRRDSLPVDRVVRTTCSPNCTGRAGSSHSSVTGTSSRSSRRPTTPTSREPAWLHEGHLLSPPESTVPIASRRPLVRDRARGSGSFREASWTRCSTASPESSSASARSGAGTACTCSARCPAPATSRRAPPTAPAPRWG